MRVVWVGVAAYLHMGRPAEEAQKVEKTQQTRAAELCIAVLIAANMHCL